MLMLERPRLTTFDTAKRRRPKLRAVCGSRGAFQKSGGRDGADVGEGAVVVARHDHGMRNVADVGEDFIQLGLSPQRVGFDFEMIVDERETFAGRPWRVDVDPEVHLPAVLDLALDFGLEKPLGTSAASSLGEVVFRCLTGIPVIGLGLELSALGVDDGETRKHCEAEEAVVALPLEIRWRMDDGL